MKKEYTLIKIESEKDINLSEIVSFLIKKDVGRIEVLNSSRLEKVKEIYFQEPNIRSQGIKIFT